MTCIAGLAVNGKVILGADSCVSTDIEQYQAIHPKIRLYEINVENGTSEHMVMGFCGSLRVLQLVMYGFDPPMFRKECQSTLEYLVTDFTDMLQEILNGRGLIYKSKTGAVCFDGEIVIGFRGELFTLMGDFSVLSVVHDGYTAGSGSNFARGSLFSTARRKPAMKPKARIEEALECASVCNLHTKPPFDIIEV